MSQAIAFLGSFSCTRELLFAIPGQLVIICVADRILEREHSRIPIITIMLAKVLLFYYWEIHLGGNSSFFITLPPYYIVYCLWRDILTAVVFIYVYSESLVKAMIAIPFTEMTASLVSMPPLILINILEGRKNLTEIPGKLMLPDFFLPVLIILMWLLLKRPLDIVMKKIRNWQPAHKKLVIGVSLFYLLLCLMDPLRSSLLATTGVRRFYAIHIIASILVIGTLMLWVRNQNLETERQNKYLEEQLRLMQDHYRLIRKSQSIVEEKRKQLAGLEQLIKEGQTQPGAVKNPAAVQKADGLPELDEQVIEEYVAQLKKDYQELNAAGIYCSDTEIDAVLCVEKEVLEQKGIHTEISASSFAGGGIKTDQLVRILVLLFEEAMNWKITSLQLEMKTVKNQLLITAKPSGKWRRERRRALKQQVRQAEGTMSEQKSESALLIMIPVVWQE